MTAADVVVPPEIPVEVALGLLRNAVLECADDAISQADALIQQVILLAARVDLLAATAARTTGNTPYDHAKLSLATQRVEELAPADPDMLLELVTAQLVADENPEAITATLAALQAGQAGRLEPHVAAAAVKYLLNTGHTQQARRLLDGLLPTSRSIPPWGTTATGVSVASTELSSFARQLLAEVLTECEEQLVRSPGDRALRRLHASTLVEFEQHEKGLQEIEAILDRDPSDDEMVWAQVVTLMRLKRYEQALALLGRLPAPISSAPAVLALRVRLLLVLGQPDAAAIDAADAARRHPQQIDVRLALVEALIANGRQDEARKEVDGLLLEHPGNPDLLRVRGTALYASGDLTGGMEALRRAVDADPGDPDTRAALARALSDAGDLEAALAHLDAALDGHPERSDILLTRVRVLRLSGRSVEALETLDRFPEGAAEGTWELRGDLLLELNREPEAVSWYARCLRRARDAGETGQRFVENLERIAQRLYKQDRYQQGLDALAPARRAGLLSPAALSLRAELLRLTEKWHESLAQADELLALGVGEVWLGGTKAATLIALSRSREALDLLATVLEESPGYLFARTIRIVALDALGRVTDARRELEEHFADEANLDSWMVWAVMARAQLLIDAARYEDAVGILRAALEHGREEADWYGPLAVAYNRMGKPRRALNTMRKAFTVANDNVDEWQWVELADTLSVLHHGADEEAVGIYKRVAAKRDHETIPKNVALRAWCQFRLGEFEGAIARYRAAIKAASDPLLDVRLRFGIWLFLLGLPDHEERMLARAQADLAEIQDRAAAKGLAAEAGYVLKLLEQDIRYADNKGDFAQIRRHWPSSVPLP
jgi:tetratricopeptide (TPR) repeat protein